MSKTGLIAVGMSMLALLWYWTKPVQPCTCKTDVSDRQFSRCCSITVTV